MNQLALLADSPPAQEAPAPPPTLPEQARLRGAVRNQVEKLLRDLDSLVAEDHPVRGLWGFLGKLDLSRFYREIKAVLDRPGRPATDPQEVLALWVYATAEGVGSPRGGWSGCATSTMSTGGCAEGRQ